MVAMDTLDQDELVKILRLVLRRYQQCTGYVAGFSLVGSWCRTAPFFIPDQVQQLAMRLIEVLTPGWYS